MGARSHRHDRRNCGRCGKLVGYRLDGLPMAHQCPHRVICIQPYPNGGYRFLIHAGQIACGDCIARNRITLAGKAITVAGILRCAVCHSKLDLDGGGIVRCDVCNTSNVDFAHPARFTP